jgi:quercetin dioxygenase-like cupin family protein
MKRVAILSLLFSAMLACGGTAAAQGMDVVGSWKLVSVTGTAPDGKTNAAPFGVNPTGELHYTADGRVMLMVSYGGRPQLSVADRVTAPVAERAAAFATHFDYAGSYVIADGKVTHHIEVSSIQNWVGTDLVRVVKVEGRRLTLTTPPLPGSGGGASNELVWERIARAAAAKPAADGRTELRREDLAGAPGMEVVLSLSTLVPGEELPSHFHHGIETGYVLQGGMVEAPGRAPYALVTGNPIMNLRDVVHGGFKVVGDQPIQFLVVHIVDKGKPLYDTGKP